MLFIIVEEKEFCINEVKIKKNVRIFEAETNVRLRLLSTEQLSILENINFCITNAKVRIITRTRKDGQKQSV